MDSFVPALVAALLAASTDKPSWLAAILGERWPHRNAVIAGIATGQVALMAIAAIGAMAIGSILNSSARSLFAGISLIVAAIGAAMPAKPPVDRLDSWRIGPTLTGAFGIFILGFGEGAQFVALGFAIRGSDPWLAAAGASIGAIVPGLVAATLGETGWSRLPLNVVGIIGGMLLGLWGIGLALSGLRLI